MKTTAIAPSNIAFIKYWGKKDEILRLPENGSISMCLSNLLTTTTVEFSKTNKEDEIILNGILEDRENNRAVKHLDRIRKKAGLTLKAHVVTNNNFPTATGLSSSASGFAALTLAGVKAAGLNLSEKELSILARRGSGSACRSIPDGFVEWLDGEASESSYAVSLYPPDYWDICDVVAVVSKEKKDVPTTEGMKIVSSSPFFPVRLANIKNKIEKIKKLIENKNFSEFGEMVEAEALELHAIMLTSKPSLIYLMPNSLLLMKMVKKWRRDGLPVYFTINTGQDIHLICEGKNVEKLEKLLQAIPEVKKIIINRPSMGARLTDKHLF